MESLECVPDNLATIDARSVDLIFKRLPESADWLNREGKTCIMN